MTEYPSYEVNPYDLDKDAKFFVTRYVPDGEYINDEGVIDDKLKAIKLDTKPFIKLFKEALPIIESISSMKAIRVLMRMLDDLKELEDEVMIHAPTYAKYFGVKNTRDVNEGVKELLDKDIISRKAEPHHYFVNTRLLFNGNRTRYNAERLK